MSSGSGKTGIVYLVGAGPGHPGLITRMGYDLLQHCDAVAYDALIPMELIASLPERVERHYVGRRAGRHSMPQSEKNRLLVHLAQRGLTVVRLKGGDTAFFGGSAEEAECLAASGIPVVVVPGVTAASAVAAASGLPLTDRRGASWVFFATGHGAAGDALPVPWREIAGLRGGTVVIYMGLANLEQIVNLLLAGGQAGNTPCMAVQGATTGVQRIVDSTLSEVVQDCRRQQLKPPALVIVGQVAQHRASLSHLSTPLSGKRILATCCARETEAVCASLRSAGAEPLPYPTWILEPFNDSEGWNRFAKLTSSGGWCIFRSPLEVNEFVSALMRNGLDLRSLGKFRITSFGPGTEAALLRKSIRADVAMPSLPPALSRRDLTALAGSAGILAADHLVIFSEETEMDGTEWAEVLRLRLFNRKPAVWEPHWIQEVRDNPPDYILFRTPSDVDGFLSVLGPELACALARQCSVIAADALTESAVRHQDLAFNTGKSRAFFEILESGRPTSETKAIAGNQVGPG
jgi:uroporphyrinogen III methyltransferase/synthase